MITPRIAGPDWLRLRMLNPAQVEPTAVEAEMPPYMESFLAHLRLLVGVPFEYLIPDPRFLPDESIRFFYLDRSWTDRLVDGAIAVGKIGTREQAHHQAHHEAVSQRLDQTERTVRDLQRGASFPVSTTFEKAEIVTGFLLRSGAVSGWPRMDVRAYSEDIPERLDPANAQVQAKQLLTLRLERLSPAILLALFKGIPKLVYLEEEHHGVQFGVGENFHIDLRDGTGQQIPPLKSIGVPVRAANNRVVAVAAMRRDLITERLTRHDIPEQKGSAAFAIEMLNLPWRQRFEGVQDHAHESQGSGAFVPTVKIGDRVQFEATKAEFTKAIAGGH